VIIDDRETARVFEIFVISASRRSPFVIRDTLSQARETANETVDSTGCEVEIVDHITREVVERHAPPGPT
jgi:hypothetical protein